MEAKVDKIGIIMNGVTGRMGTNQHLMRSIAAIIREGGISIDDSQIILPDPILVGRNEAKLQDLASRSGVERWSTDLDAVLSDPNYAVYFDAQTTTRRAAALQQAITAGKHIYSEKPIATTAKEGFEIYRLADAAGVKHSVVQDKLWLPGFLKLKSLTETGFFGQLLSVRGEFGYWVFEGDNVESQRPSWNYRKEDGGGIILDMFPHWCYLLDNLFGRVQAVSCIGTTNIKKRWDENKHPYDCTADDAAYATFKLENDVIAHFNSSWATRVYRDDLLTIQVDGTKGSALVTLRDCIAQSYSDTPRPVWNPDEPNPMDFRNNWSPVSGNREYTNAFKAQWELFLMHVVNDTPYQYGLQHGARGLLLADKGIESWEQARWINMDDPH